MMEKAAGIVREVDPLGRITIPKSFRDSYNLKPGGKAEIFASSTGVFIRNYDEKQPLGDRITAIMEDIRACDSMDSGTMWEVLERLEEAHQIMMGKE